MPEEQDNKPSETPSESKPQNGPKEIKIIELNESFAGKSQPGNQGILLNPVGGHNTDPFVSQDTPASPMPPAPTTSPAITSSISAVPTAPQTTPTLSTPVSTPQKDASASDE